MSQACLQLPSAPASAAESVVNELYKDYGAFILGYVTRLLGDRYLAEDVVQETMLRAWRHSGELSSDKGSVRGWLSRVAHNIALDKIRMRRSRPAEVAADVAPDAMVEDHADAVVSAMAVRQVLSRLSPGQRDVLEQMYVHGRTARETARRLGIPEGTVFSRSYHALRILRRELGAPAGEPALRAA